MADRAVSTVVSYVLILGIVALLITILMSVFVPLVTDQQQETVRSTFEVLGNDVAGDIERVDRLATEAGSNGTVTYRTRLPSRVGGSFYDIEIAPCDELVLCNDPGGDGYYYGVTMRSEDHDTRTTVRLRTEHEIAVGQIGTIDAEAIEISFEGSLLEVEDA